MLEAVQHSRDKQGGSVLWLDGMTWATRLFDATEVNAAAKTLINDHAVVAEMDYAYMVLNNWRAIHNFPLNTLKMGLRAKARRVDGSSLTAQRIKRLSSIESKLRRFPNMKLSQMQDIGGCRAILNSISDVYAVKALLDESQMKHKLVKTDNYIKEPKDSGYRGVHLVYRYFSDRNDSYNDLKIEVQVRSKLQHAWATAVETLGTFTRQALKSSVGEQDVLRFFALMSSYIARREKAPTVPNTPTDATALKEELREYESRLDLENRLAAYNAALKIFRDDKFRASDYFLLKLDPLEGVVHVSGYRTNQLAEATREYTEVERGIAEKTVQYLDAVLVSVDSMTSLKCAFPNYFADTRVFLDTMKKALA
jgi:ppGpp synthetase/RelA/SpoT-type nucleotidyltranferase